jgi:hypothetical protein
VHIVARAIQFTLRRRLHVALLQLAVLQLMRALERVLALHIVGRHARFAARMCHDMTSEHERTIRAKSSRDAARFCDICARTRAPQALQLPADL